MYNIKKYMTMGPNNLKIGFYIMYRYTTDATKTQWLRRILSELQKIFSGWVHFADTAKLLTFEKMWPHISLQPNIPFFSKSSQEGNKKEKLKVGVCVRENRNVKG